MPAFQGANLEPGNRVSGRVSARVFLQGFERPYGWGHSGLTGTKHGTSLQSAEPSGVARPPTQRDPVGLRTGWLGNQQLIFPPAQERQTGAGRWRGTPPPWAAPINWGVQGPSRPLTPPTAQPRPQQGQSKATSPSHVRSVSEMEKWKI